MAEPKEPGGSVWERLEAHDRAHARNTKRAVLLMRLAMLLSVTPALLRAINGELPTPLLVALLLLASGFGVAGLVSYRHSTRRRGDES